MYQFTEDCLIGIEQIDKEHRTLFTLINEAAELPAEARTARTVSQILARLTDYAATHFSHEEAYMSEHDDPELPLQKKEHKAFTEHVQSLVAQPLTDQNASAILNEILPFLIRWLYRHILSSDMMIGKLTPTDPFAFTAKYHTGIKEIDAEHKPLFDIIRETNALIHNDLLHDKYDEIIHLLDELREYTKIHFAYEADAFFPDLDSDPEWELAGNSEEQTYFDLEYEFDRYERKQ